MTEEDHTERAATEPMPNAAKQNPVCSKCGPGNIVMDAWASWNPETQMWELKDVFDHTFCLNCEEEAKLDWNSRIETKKQNICRLNDELRKGHCENGQILLTSGIRGQGQKFVAEVAKAVAEFDAFSPDNDPHLEHDFGSLGVCQQGK